MGLINNPLQVCNFKLNMLPKVLTFHFIQQHTLSKKIIRAKIGSSWFSEKEFCTRVLGYRHNSSPTATPKVVLQ